MDFGDPGNSGYDLSVKGELLNGPVRRLVKCAASLLPAHSPPVGMLRRVMMSHIPAGRCSHVNPLVRLSLAGVQVLQTSDLLNVPPRINRSYHNRLRSVKGVINHYPYLSIHAVSPTGSVTPTSTCENGTKFGWMDEN